MEKKADDVERDADEDTESLHDTEKSHRERKKKKKENGPSGPFLFLIPQIKKKVDTEKK